MPTDYAIKDGRTVMDVSLWTGTGSAQTITNSGFKPDMVWTKCRNDTFGHVVDDTVRGAALTLQPQANSAEVNEGSNGLVAFNSNGFNIGGGSGGWNVSGKTYVGWQWNAGSGTTSSNTNGSVTSTVSVNTAAGFSICTFNAGSSGAKTFGHGLSSAPKLVIVKSRTSAVDWVTYHASAISNVNTYLVLNTSNAPVTATGIWGSALPTSTVVGFTSGTICFANDNMVAYCWAEVAGFSKFGSYTGNGSTDGPFVYTGFRPKFVMVKRTDSTGDWAMEDTSRDRYNVAINALLANSSTSELSYLNVDYLSNGFKPRTTDGSYNVSGGNYIYMAFAENPFKYANAR